MIELEGGRPVRVVPLEVGVGALPGVEGASVRIFESAKEARVPISASEEWSNPVAQVEYRYQGEIHSVMLSAEHSRPLGLPDGETVLSFESDHDEAKAYRSRLAVIEDGQRVLTKTISVNDPLSYGGYSFYQSNYRKEDLTYSGIMVVKDPGLPVVLTGLALICVGAVWSFYVRPRLIRRIRS